MLIMNFSVVTSAEKIDHPARSHKSFLTSIIWEIYSSPSQSIFTTMTALLTHTRLAYIFIFVSQHILCPNGSVEFLSSLKTRHNNHNSFNHSFCIHLDYGWEMEVGGMWHSVQITHNKLSARLSLTSLTSHLHNVASWNWTRGRTHSPFLSPPLLFLLALGKADLQVEAVLHTEVVVPLDNLFSIFHCWHRHKTGNNTQASLWELLG